MSLHIARALLAYLACRCHGFRVHVTSEDVRGGASAHRRAQEVRATEHARKLDPLSTLAVSLLGAEEPKASWQVAGLRQEVARKRLLSPTPASAQPTVLMRQNQSTGIAGGRELPKLFHSTSRPAGRLPAHARGKDVYMRLDEDDDYWDEEDWSSEDGEDVELDPKHVEEVEVVDSGMLEDVKFEHVVAYREIKENMKADYVTHPNALQRAAFDPIADGRDVIMHAWTGCGKTIAFLMPLLQKVDPKLRAPQVLILMPSRDLAHQVFRVAEQYLAGSPFRVAIYAGGANAHRQLEKTKGVYTPHFIIGTPGRILDLAFEWRRVNLMSVRHIVLDEVDHMLQEPTLPQVLQLVDFCKDGRPLQTILASATADTPPVRRAIARLMTKPLLLRLITAGGRENMVTASGAAAELPPSLYHGVVVAPQMKRLDEVRKLFFTEPVPSILVFVNSPYRVKDVSKKLWERFGVPAAPLYGAQSREERTDVMKKLKDGLLRLTVATEMAARGLDIPYLTHVVNLDLPTDPLHYIHRAGRCGRAGAEGMVLNLVENQNIWVVSKITKQLGVPLSNFTIKGGEVFLMDEDLNDREKMQEEEDLEMKMQQLAQAMEVKKKKKKKREPAYPGRY
mmetsp:Transcript_56571/g.103889  ORF Transcript_56571/g.103889 Transcript_56571/m.103889 type:complete len:621 (-) Transcript_56571:148-2010(-)